jgi:hypothetical protein
MALKKSDGPPASAKQLQYLVKLLQQEGFTGFRDARRAYSLTQRQASGRFTVGDASALIDRLVSKSPGENRASSTSNPTDVSGPGDHAERPVDARTMQVFGRRRATTDPDELTGPFADLIRGVPATVLAEELQRRGWAVEPPAD